MATLDNNWKVGTSPIFTPAANVGVEHQNIAGSSSGRTEDGVMHIDWVRRDCIKISISYGYLNDAELAYILNLVQGKEFTFHYLDQGQHKSINAYCSNCSYTLYHYNQQTGAAMYKDVSFNVIEK